MTSKKTSKIFSDHLVKIFVWNEEKKKSSYESIKISYSIKHILTKLNINDENIFLYLGHEKFPFKLKSCNLDIPIVKIFFDVGIDTTYKNNKGIDITYKNKIFVFVLLYFISPTFNNFFVMSVKS